MPLISPDSYLPVSYHLWRSPQPSLKSLAGLKEQGLTAVYNLRKEFCITPELCQQLDLKHVAIPVLDMSLPTREQVDMFVRHVYESPGKGLVHCNAGCGRTGVFVACYRKVILGLSTAAAIQITEEEFAPMTSAQREWVRYNFCDSMSVTKLITLEDRIDQWHESDSDLPLHEFLGWTHDEYKAWLEDGKS